MLRRERHDRRARAGPRKRRWPVWLLAGLVALLLVAEQGSGLARSGGVLSSNPFWFEDDYLTLDWTDQGQTTAAVDTAPPGTIRLPLQPGIVAFSPPGLSGSSEQRIMLVGSGLTLQAWSWDGAGMVREPGWDITAAAGKRLEGATFLNDGTSVALATDAEVEVWAWDGAGWREVALAPEQGAVGVAPGVGAGVVVARQDGLDVFGWDGTALVKLPGAGVGGLSGIRGTASSDGGLVLLWSDAAITALGWDGQEYREAPTWEPPAGSVQGILSVAAFPDGAGYWVLTGGAQPAVTAYGYDGSYVVKVPAWAPGSLPEGANAVAAGWDSRSVAVLGRSATGYWEWDGAEMREVAAEEVAGLNVAGYETQAVYQSSVLAVDHPVSKVQLDLAGTFPAGTSVTAQVSTDGGATWTDVQPCVNPVNPATECAQDNRAVPPGQALVYRLVLGTQDASTTPVIDRADLLEIVQVILTGQKVEVKLIR